MHVFVENISNDVLEAVFGVLEPAVAIGRAIQLPNWRCKLATGLARLADAILLFQIAQGSGTAVGLFSKWVFVNFRHAQQLR
jgi:hypothetical protein